VLLYWDEKISDTEKAETGLNFIQIGLGVIENNFETIAEKKIPKRQLNCKIYINESKLEILWHWAVAESNPTFLIEIVPCEPPLKTLSTVRTLRRDTISM
jgi:hypothetical protein